MEHKLKLNDHKGGWENKSKERLFALLRQEVDELEAALKDEPDLSIMFEAADVANFAMMIAWNSMREMLNSPVPRIGCSSCGNMDCTKTDCDGIPF